MKNIISALMLGGCVIAGMSTSALSVEWSNNSDRGPNASVHLRSYGETTPPIGFVNFCRQYGQQCRDGANRDTVVAMDNSRWAELSRINDYVNAKIAPVTDQELYNVPEHWTYPQSQGDCEDYVLLKKHYLEGLGWPKESLLITVVLDENNAGHAVLTVTTDLGDFVLDNQNMDILPWRDTPYRYIKRQSQLHPAVWVSLDPNWGSSNSMVSGRLTTDR